MKVFAIIRVEYDWNTFETLEDVGSDLDKLKDVFSDLPMFSEDEVNCDDFESPSYDGDSHYYYVEYDIMSNYNVKYLGVLSPRPSVYHGDKAMSPEQVAQRLNQLTEALTEAAEWIRTREDFKVSASEALEPIETLLKGLA